MSESTWLRIRKYIDDHRNQAVYASVFLILLFIGGFWWYLLQIGQVPMAYAGVAGSVFIDENVDGVFDGTEFGFPGVLLRLISAAGVEVTAVSDSSGVYGFNVLAGSYTLSMEEEPGWFSTTPSTVSLTLNENDVVFVDFGSYFETPVDETLYGIVEGVVFRDLNLDGAFDEVEPGMTEVHIGLYDSEGVLVAETLSVEEGLFSFTLLEPGEYTVLETIPEDYFNTTSALVPVTVEADTVVEVLFGLEDESRLDSGDSDAAVYGFVYNDKIRNRMRDASERGIEGVTIEVFDGDESVSSAVTDENGFYVIALGSGSYRVVEHDLPGWESATPNEVDVTLSLGDRAQVNFGDWESPIVEEIPDISGAVFDDQDGDGLRDDGEPGIEGVSVELWRGETMTDETVTDEDGAYSFIDLPLNVYTVKEVQPDGWQSTTPDEVVADLEDGISVVVDFGETKGAVISGTVYNDVNTNGVNNGEDGIPGVTVKLLLSDELVAEEVTDANGGYEFTVLKAGTYTVVEKNLDYYNKNSTPNSVEAPIVSLTGQTVTVNFGDYHSSPIIIVDYYGTIRCYVFHDADDDGVWDEEESPVPGVAVDLYRGDLNLDTVHTNEVGLADFGKYLTGAYKVVETDLLGWVSTTDNTVQFTLSRDEIEEIEFGDRRKTRIMGVVYDDADVDKERDAEEEGIEDVSVELWRGETMTDETLTDEDGAYVFYVSTAGDYMVKEHDLTGWKSSTLNQMPVTVVEVEEEVHEVDFGDYLPQYGEIWGIAFDDVDVDGENGDEPGIEGVVVSLFDEDGFVDETTSDEDGEYWFTELPPGVYEVRAPRIDDYFRTTPGSVMPLVEAGDEKQIDFGYTYIENDFGVIYGTVFNDKDGDLGRGFGELGLSEVTVSLLLGTEPVTTETTNEYGCYSIRIDVSDTYKLEETNLGGWHSTTPDEYSFPMHTANDNDSPWDFGDTLGATVSGVVWDDEDRDTVKGAEETGIEGVLVELFLGEVLVDDTLTAGDGSYSFLALASGDYTVKETDLVGWESSTPEEVPVSIGELTGQALVDKDFGDYYFGIDIAYTFRKEVKGYDDTWQDDQAYQLTGDPVSYQFVIVNDGNVDLTDLVISDPMLDTLDPQQDPIDVGTVAAGSQETLGPYTITAVKGSYTNTATLTGNHLLGTVNEVDTATYDAGTPEISVTKEVSINPGGPWSKNIDLLVGETVYYRFTLENTGDVPLSGVEVVDSHFGTIVDSLTLDVGASEEYFEQINDADADKQENTVTANGEWQGIPAPEAEDSAYYFGIDIAYTFRKEVKGYDDTWQDIKTYQLIGESVSYQFVIVNDGNVDLTDVVIDDPDLGVNIDVGTVSVGGSYTSPVETVTALEGIHTNTATLNGETFLGPLVEMEDSAEYEAAMPGITLTKEVSLDEATWDSHVEVPVGETVYFRFTVENTGDVEVTNLDGYDPDLGQTIEFVDTTLAPGGTTVNKYTVSVSALHGLNENTAEAYADWYGVPAEAEGSASYTGKIMGITVTKMVKDCWGVWREDGAEVVEGALVDFKVTVKNTGEVPLSDVVVSDMMFGTLSPTSLTLQPDEEVTYIRSTTETWPEYNEAWAEGYWNGYQTHADDVLYYEVVEPELGIEVLKEIKDSYDVWHKGIDTMSDPVEFLVGDTVTYRFTLTNTGNVGLVDIDVDDNVLGIIDMPTTLAAGATMVSDEITRVAEVGLHENYVDVTSYDEINNDWVWGMDSASYFGVEPAPEITVTKEVNLDGSTGWTDHLDVVAGTTVWFRVQVENTGNTPLTGVTWMDSMGTVPYLIGDMQPGEGWENTDSWIAEPGLFENTAEATGQYDGQDYSDDDVASVFGGVVEMKLTKYVKDPQGQWQDDSACAIVGTTVDYMYVLENTGNVPISVLAFYDETLNIDFTTGILGFGETWTEYASTTAELGVHPNQAKAEGQWMDNWVYVDDWAQYVGTSLPSTVTVTLVKPHPTGLGYFLTTVSGGTSLDGVYEGWCIDSDTGAVLNTPFPANVYCSYGSLPTGLVEKPWNLDLINWIINQDYVGKIADDGYPFTYGDLQMAIWTLIEDNFPPVVLPYTQVHVDQIVSAAQANGEGYVPGGGAYLVVILAPVQGGQPSIIKIQVP